MALFTGPLTPGARSESDAAVAWLLAPTRHPRWNEVTLGAGDVDGDSVADLVIGNGSDTVGGADAGAVFFLPHAGCEAARRSPIRAERPAWLRAPVVAGPSGSPAHPLPEPTDGTCGPR